jgi:hypothetical protein
MSICRRFQPRTLKAALLLVVERQDPAQVAEELGMTLDTVYTAKSRVLKRLRDEWAELCRDGMEDGRFLLPIIGSSFLCLPSQQVIRQ